MWEWFVNCDDLINNIFCFGHTISETCQHSVFWSEICINMEIKLSFTPKHLVVKRKKDRSNCCTWISHRGQADSWFPAVATWFPHRILLHKSSDVCQEVLRLGSWEPSRSNDHSLHCLSPPPNPTQQSPGHFLCDFCFLSLFSAEYSREPSLNPSPCLSNHNCPYLGVLHTLSINFLLSLLFFSKRFFL